MDSLRRRRFAPFAALAAGCSIVFAAGCSDGTNALYDPENTFPLKLTLELYSPATDTVPFKSSSKTYRLPASCSTLKLSPHLTSSNTDNTVKVWKNEEIVVELKIDFRWWIVQERSKGIRDTLSKFGYAPLLHCSELRSSATAHFLMVDSKGDSLRDSLTILLSDTASIAP